MIKIEVDEAYAYDMLSILEIKFKKINFGTEPHDNHYKLQELLREQIGPLRHTEIVMSNEFQRLYDANLKIFELVDEIKKYRERIYDAKLIDDLNFERFKSKKALQQKFFPDNKITEQKIGYKE